MKSVKIQIQLLGLAISQFIVTPVQAQFVADGATNTLSNSTNTFTGDVTIGTNGSFTLLVLSDNALLTNSLNGIIGRNSTAKSDRQISVVGPERAGTRQQNNVVFTGKQAGEGAVVGNQPGPAV